MDDTRQRYSAVTCSCACTGAHIGSDDHCNTLASSIFNMVDWRAKGRKRQAAMAVNSSRNGSTERSTRKGRAGVLPSGSCLPPGTDRAGDRVVVAVSHYLYEYECTLGADMCGVTMRFDGRYE